MKKYTLIAMISLVLGGCSSVSTQTCPEGQTRVGGSQAVCMKPCENKCRYCGRDCGIDYECVGMCESFNK